MQMKQSQCMKLANATKPHTTQYNTQKQTKQQHKHTQQHNDDSSRGLLQLNSTHDHNRTNNETNQLFLLPDDANRNL